MTFADLLATLPRSYDDLIKWALILNQQSFNVLNNIRQIRIMAQHHVQPVATVDGRYILCADLLTEIGKGGIFEDGFKLLPSTLFSSVEVLPWNEALTLLPPPTEIFP